MGRRIAKCHGRTRVKILKKKTAVIEKEEKKQWKEEKKKEKLKISEVIKRAKEERRSKNVNE